jgi:indole-3-glycerol phosphate synthase
LSTGFLLDILAAKREELTAAKARRPLVELKAMAEEQPLPLSLAQVLRSFGVRFIAEIKRASPSKGPLRPDLDPGSLARSYAEKGAAAISVLTEGRHFGGSLEDLRAAKLALKDKLVPLLRKDFIFDPYQIYEARALGADAVLLIATVLDNPALAELLALSYDLGMRCLVEVHDEAELERAVACGAGIIGINNRDLKTFEVDLSASLRLAPLVPRDRIVVSESGIRNREDVELLARAGVDAVLVGEALVTAEDPGEALGRLMWSG